MVTYKAHQAGVLVAVQTINLDRTSCQYLTKQFWKLMKILNTIPFYSSLDSEEWGSIRIGRRGLRAGHEPES